jgi:hypothetical protein
MSNLRKQVGDKISAVRVGKKYVYSLPDRVNTAPAQPPADFPEPAEPAPKPDIPSSTAPTLRPPHIRAADITLRPETPTSSIAAVTSNDRLNGLHQNGRTEVQTNNLRMGAKLSVAPPTANDFALIAHLYEQRQAEVVAAGMRFVDTRLTQAIQSVGSNELLTNGLPPLEERVAAWERVSRVNYWLLPAELRSDNMEKFARMIRFVKSTLPEVPYALLGLPVPERAEPKSPHDHPRLPFDNARQAAAILMAQRTTFSGMGLPVPSGNLEKIVPQDLPSMDAKRKTALFRTLLDIARDPNFEALSQEFSPTVRPIIEYFHQCSGDAYALEQAFMSATTQSNHLQALTHKSGSGNAKRSW